MRPIVTTSLLAIFAAVSISACSNASNNTAATASSASADNGMSSAASDNGMSSAASDNGAAADNSAAAASAGDVPLYPGAVADTLPAAAGSPPPGGKSYSTADTPAKVQAWYAANVKNAVLKGSTPTGSMFLIGDMKTEPSSWCNPTAARRGSLPDPQPRSVSKRGSDETPIRCGCYFSPKEAPCADSPPDAARGSRRYRYVGLFELIQHRCERNRFERRGIVGSRR